MQNALVLVVFIKKNKNKIRVSAAAQTRDNPAGEELSAPPCLERLFPMRPNPREPFLRAAACPAALWLAQRLKEKARQAPAFPMQDPGRCVGHLPQGGRGDRGDL